MDRLLLLASSLCFLFSFAYTMYALGARIRRPSRFNLTALLAGFALQTGFLYLRGHEDGRCPLTTPQEVLVFLSWSMGLFYVVVGPAFRLSLLGFFTSPFVFLLTAVALMLPRGTVVPPGTVDPWLEMHAALSVVAYGAFALACAAGLMYLAQERQLKTHHIGSIFHHLPPITDLAVANRRLMAVGLLLLTAGLLAGVMVSRPLDLMKVWWGIGVWVLYAGILLLQTGWLRQLSPRRAAALSVVGFTLTLCSLWSLNFIA